MPSADSPHAATVVVVLGVVGVILTIAVAILTVVKLWRGLTAPKAPDSGKGISSVERDADVEARLRRLERHVAALEAGCRAEHGAPRRRDSHPGEVDE